MTREQIEKLEALSRAATPPPWDESLYRNEGWVTGPKGSMTVGYDGEMTGEDVRLIAAMRNALPRLLLERERLREQVLAAIGQCCGRLCLQSAPDSLCIACQERRKALAFVEEEA